MKSNSPFRVIIGFLAAVFLVVVAIKALAFSDARVSTDMYVNGESIRGLSVEEAEGKVLDYLSQLRDREIAVQADGREYRFTAEALGIGYPVDVSLDHLRDTHRSGISYVVSLVSEYFSSHEFEPAVRFDEAEVSARLSEAMDSLMPRQNASFAVQDGKWKVVPGVTGREADLQRLVQDIKRHASAAGSLEYELEVSVREPDFTTADAQSLLPALESMTSRPHELTVMIGQVVKRFPVNLRESADAIEVRGINGGWEVAPSRAWLTAKLASSVLPLVERAPEHVEISGFEDRGGRMFAAAAGIARDGFRIDAARTIDTFLENTATGIFETAMVAEVVPAEVHSPDATLRFPDRLSIGLSNYATSSADRVHNVKLGLSKFHNRILMPGETLNFNEHIVPVTNAAGYKNELALFGGGGAAKVPGGGLCQVSSTVYRGFLNGGFPILERYPHSAYVHYYTAYQDGLDATIYPTYGNQKGKDLRIKNDNPYPVLIQAFTNDEAEDAVVQIYGIDDGRRVQLTGPIYAKDFWPGTDRIADPSLPPGVEKVDRLGSYSKLIQWERDITYADGFTKNEKINSLYPGYKRVVRYGTGG